MCGIGGLYQLGQGASLDQATRSAQLEQMMAALSHRGPDSSGIWHDDQLPLALGHRRLAIVDLSSQGHQPMLSASGRYVLVYNGEIYNFLDIKRILQDKGHHFNGHSDTEVMLAAFEQWGVNIALQKLHGMFAAALFDKQRGELHFFRDRFGKKPLYIGWAGESLLFGSELKAFMTQPDFKAHKSIDRNVLALYMRLSYVPAPYSIFKNMWSLPAGHRLTLSLAGLQAGTDISQKFERYFDPAQILSDQRDLMDTRMTLDMAVSGLDDVLGAAVERRLISDVPIGAFLSGGIDSSLIVALMQKSMSEAVNTFSIGFNEPKYNEAEFAKQVAAHLGTKHHEFYVDGRAALDSLQAMADFYDEPFADASQIPTYLVAQQTSKAATVVLTGDGGDEMFGGYKRHFQGPAIWRKMRIMPAALRAPLAKALKFGLPQSLQGKSGGLNRLLEVLPARSMQHFYDLLAEQWHSSHELVRGASRLERPMFDMLERLPKLKAEEQMIFSDVLSHLPDRMLVKVDRASMATSIETRAPFLDTEVYKYAWGLPLQHKIHGGKGKFVVRELLSRYVPRELFERPKQGFTPPLTEWLCGDLKDWAQALIFDGRNGGAEYFELNLVENAWKRMQAGSLADTNRIWNIVMFQLWAQRWMK